MCAVCSVPVYGISVFCLQCTGIKYKCFLFAVYPYTV